MNRVVLSVVLALVLGLTQAREKTNNVTDTFAITMTTNKFGIVKIGLNGTGTATVDWGNGKTNNKNLSHGLKVFTHYYFGKSHRNITIYGQNITHLDCKGNQLTSLNVSNNIALKSMQCSKNQLTNLDLSKNTELIFLQCSKNQLAHLNVSRNTTLINLVCDGNQITCLDVSKNTVLSFVNCRNNQLSTEALNAFFGTLNSSEEEGKILYIRNNYGTNTCNESIATKKGWRIDTSFI